MTKGPQQATMADGKAKATTAYLESSAFVELTQSAHRDGYKAGQASCAAGPWRTDEPPKVDGHTILACYKEAVLNELLEELECPQSTT